MEAVMTQLVFEHALRIRLHAPSAQADDKLVSAPSATVEHTEPRQPADEPGIEVEPEASSSVDATTLVSDGQESNNGKTTAEISDPSTKAPADDQKARKSLIGIMTNLVTTDLSILRAPCAHLLDARE